MKNPLDLAIFVKNEPNSLCFDTGTIRKIESQINHVALTLQNYKDALFIYDYFSKNDIDVYNYEILFRFRDVISIFDVETPDIERLEYNIHATQKFLNKLEPEIRAYKEYVELQVNTLYELFEKNNKLIPITTKNILLDTDLSSVKTSVRNIEKTLAKIKDNEFLKKADAMYNHLARINHLLTKVK